MPNRQQAIIWTNADPIHWRIYAALGGNELNWVALVKDKAKNQQKYQEFWKSSTCPVNKLELEILLPPDNFSLPWAGLLIFVSHDFDALCPFDWELTPQILLQKWVSQHLQWLATWLFVEQLVQAYIKCPYYLPFVRWIHWYWWTP